jgi:hypothetical protein
MSDNSDDIDDIVDLLMSSTPEGIISLLVVLLDRQNIININAVKDALEYFDNSIPYPYICIKGGANRYTEVIEKLKQDKSVLIKGCRLPNIKKVLKKYNIEADIEQLGQRYYLIKPKGQ